MNASLRVVGKGIVTYSSEMPRMVAALQVPGIFNSGYEPARYVIMTYHVSRCICTFPVVYLVSRGEGRLVPALTFFPVECLVVGGA